MIKTSQTKNRLVKHLEGPHVSRRCYRVYTYVCSAGFLVPQSKCCHEAMNNLMTHGRVGPSHGPLFVMYYCNFRVECIKNASLSPCTCPHLAPASGHGAVRVVRRRRRAVADVVRVEVLVPRRDVLPRLRRAVGHAVRRRRKQLPEGSNR